MRARNVVAITLLAVSLLACGKREDDPRISFPKNSGLDPQPALDRWPVEPGDPYLIPSDGYVTVNAYEHLIVENHSETDIASLQDFPDLLLVVHDLTNADRAEDTQHGFFEIFRRNRVVFAIAINVPHNRQPNKALFASRPNIEAEYVGFTTAPDGPPELEWTKVNLRLRQCLSAGKCASADVRLITKEIPGTREPRK